MKTRLTIALPVLALAFPVLAADGETLMLADFDNAPHPMFGAVVQPTSSTLDGEAAQFVNQGFKPAWKIVLPRGKAVGILESTPILAMQIRSETPAADVRFIKLHLVVQTDAMGEEVFEPLEGVSANPLRESEFRADLSQAHTANIPSLLEAAKQFDAGKGGRLILFLIQQSPEGTPNTVTYDNIRLEPR